MKILRRILLALAVVGFSFFLWVLSIDIGVVHELGQPSKVKHILSDSGLYNTVVSTALDQKNDKGQPNTINIGGNEVALNNPIIKKAATDAFPPAFIQQNVEQLIDSFNNWANGKSDKPDFKVDLTAAKATLAKDIGSGIQTRLTGLPACPAGTSAANFNAFSATCLPAGVTPASAAAIVQNDVANSKEFLSDTVFTADDIKDADGQPAFSKPAASDGRNRYERLKSSPVVLAFLALILAVAIIYLSSTKRRGFRRIGIVLILNGLIILSFISLANSAVNRVEANNDNATTKAFQISAIAAGKSLVHDLNPLYYGLSGAYLGVGVGR